MQIDRARFLLLTASLAGGGCTPVSSDPVAPPAPTPAPTEAEVVVPETPDPVATSTGQTTSVATAPSTTTAEPQPPQTPQGTCDNDTGTVPACAISAPPGPFCESFTDTKAVCKGYKQTLRGGIAAKAVACLNAASKTQAVCDYQLSEACTSASIRTACIQPSTFNLCAPMVSACAASPYNKLTLQDCQQLLSAVKDGMRQSMVTCMVEGCSLESCTWMLR